MSRKARWICLCVFFFSHSLMAMIPFLEMQRDSELACINTLNKNMRQVSASMPCLESLRKASSLSPDTIAALFLLATDPSATPIRIAVIGILNVKPMNQQMLNQESYKDLSNALQTMKGLRNAVRDGAPQLQSQYNAGVRALQKAISALGILKCVILRAIGRE